MSRRDAIEVVEYRGYHIEVSVDPNPESPREEDNLGHMVCWHSRYNLGDKHKFIDPKDAEQYIKDTHALALPLYLYDHSGITMSTGKFSCPWDSGQVGYIYVTLDEVRKEYSCKVVTPTIRRKAYEVLEQEVKTYDQYITGKVYGYNTVETGDSCWGYFGDTEYMLSEAKSLVDGHILTMRRLHFSRLKYWIKSHVLPQYRTAMPEGACA